ncbi:MAG TPA: tyrosine-type recombinase/integrase [Polyangiaceae bacterium]
MKAGSGPVALTETADAWHGRYLKHCKAQGIVTTSSKGQRWGKWISPKLGDLPMTSVTRDHVEDVRDALDDAIREYVKNGPGEGRLSPKTAQNVWSELTVSLAEACSSKRRELRVLETNPASGVQPPERGADKGKCYPHPSEALAVFACEQIPLEWRELHALAAYTYMRPGELRVLEWSDVDLDDQQIHITKAWDYEAGEVKATKTGEIRHPPIEWNLLPLLRRMRERAGGKKASGLVVPVLSQANANKVAIVMREHFALAGCERARLTTRSNAELRLRFRSWRDAGITWSIVRGDDVVKVQRRAGHKLIGTTLRYVVESENRGATFGEPFPPLPACMLGLPKLLPKDDPSELQPTGTSDETECRRRESNP